MVPSKYESSSALVLFVPVVVIGVGCGSTVGSFRSSTHGGVKEDSPKPDPA